MDTPSTARHHTLSGLAMVLLAAMLWGTTGTAQSLIGGAGLAAHWVGALRLLFAALFFLVLLRAGASRGGARLAGLRWGPVLLGGLSMAAYNLTFFAGVKASSVAVGTAVALGSGPIFAGLLLVFVTRRAPTRAWWTGTLLAIAGGAWMVLGSAAELRISTAGIGLCLVAGLSYAVYTLVSERLVARADPAAVTFGIFGMAALIALPAAAAVSGLPQASGQGWATVAYLGVVATGLAYLLFTRALCRVASSTAVSLCLAEPLTAFCLAVAVVGERPPMAAYAGLALVMLGLALVVRSEMRRVAPSA